jgi:hypothetical protein
MERYCSTGQSPQRAVAPTEEEEDKEEDRVAVRSVQSHKGAILEEISLTDCNVFYFSEM